MIQEARSPAAVRLLVDRTRYAVHRVDDGNDANWSLRICRSGLHTTGKKPTPSTGGGANPLQDLDDLLVRCDSSSVTVFRGGCTPVPAFFWWQGAQLVISTSPDFGRRLRSDYLAQLLASAWRQPHEPLFAETPFEGVQRALKGHATRIDRSNRRVESTLLTFESSSWSASCDDDVLDLIEARIAERIRALPKTQHVGLELSGGIDSTLVGSVWNRVREDRIRTVYSIVYPFFEFRNERRHIDEARQLMRADASFVDDGVALTCLAQTELHRRFAEPNMGMYGMAQGHALYEQMRQAGCDYFLSGTAGDTLFTVGAAHFASAVATGHSPDWLHGSQRKTYNDQVHLQASIWGDAGARQRLFYAGLTLDDAWVESAFETGAPCRLSPLVTASLLPIGEWCTRPENARARLNKWPMRELLRRHGAPNIAARQGKVPYDGLYARAYIDRQHWLSALVHDMRHELEHAGADSQALAKALARRDVDEMDERNLAVAVSFLMWIRDLKRRRLSETDAPTDIELNHQPNRCLEPI